MMESTIPLPSIYFPDFIAANQSERADNVLAGTMQEQMDQVSPVAADAACVLSLLSLLLLMYYLCLGSILP